MNMAENLNMTEKFMPKNYFSHIHPFMFFVLMFFISLWLFWLRFLFSPSQFQKWDYNCMQMAVTCERHSWDVRLKKTRNYTTFASVPTLQWTVIWRYLRNRLSTKNVENVAPRNRQQLNMPRTTVPFKSQALSLVLEKF